MSLLRRRGIAAARREGAPPGFDPLSIGWHTAFYADDLTLTDLDPVATWPDSSVNSHDATQETGLLRPEYRAAYTDLGGQPAVVSGGGGDRLATAAFAATLTQPNTIVVVGKLPMDPGATLTDGIVSADRNLLYQQSDKYTLWAGSNGASTVDFDGLKHLFVGEFNGSTSRIIVDGVSTTVNPGTRDLTGLTLLSYFNGTESYAGVAIGFLGLADGLLTSGELDDLLAWSQGKYGTP